MGGWGSGRRRSITVAAVEDVPALDVRPFGRNLKPGERRAAACTLPDGTRISALVIWEGAIFRYCRTESGGAPITYPILIDRNASRVGACRLYWRCPAIVEGIRCQRRVTKLYFSQGYFLCRRCARLSYTSQHQTALKRAMTRSQRLRAKLGAVTLGPQFSQPPRPKRMWTRTYQRTLNQVDRAELIADEHFYRGLSALAARVKRGRP
jgi:hypothetical protein